MFLSLFNLYKSNSEKTPLENFTTESLVGILNILPEVRGRFIRDILELPEGNYFISTQKSYPGDAQNDGSCIDIVIESKELVCFMEVKVNSTENPGRSRSEERRVGKECSDRRRQYA